MQVKFTTRTESDIIDSYVYGLTNFGQNQADTYEEKIHEIIRLIADNPQTARERMEFQQSVRIFHS